MSNKVYCSNCEHQVCPAMGMFEPSIYYCGLFDEKKDNWYGSWAVHKRKCKKQNKYNDCEFFIQKVIR